MRVALAAAVTLLAAAPTAQAASVQKVGTELRVSAVAGESNRLKVDLDSGEWVVRDPGNPLAPGSGCSGTEQEVRCPAAPFDAAAVELGDGDDTAEVTGYRTRVNAGPGDDRVTGGTGDDTIDGGGGRDDLHGGAAGADLISDGDAAAGAFDADVLDGGPEPTPGGGDIVDYSGRPFGVAVDLRSGTGPEGDRLVGFDQVDGGDGADSLLGDALPNLLSGGAGDDVLDGGAHSDVLDGGQGADTLRGGDGDDTLAGGEGRDSLDGGAGDDVLFPGGGDGRDVLSCGSGADVVLERRFEDRMPRDCERLGVEERDVTVPARLAYRGRAVRFEVRTQPGFDVRVLSAELRARDGRLLDRTRTTRFVLRARDARPRKARLVLRLRLDSGSGFSQTIRRGFFLSVR